MDKVWARNQDTAGYPLQLPLLKGWGPLWPFFRFESPTLLVPLNNAA